MKHIYKIFFIASVLAILGQCLFAAGGTMLGNGTDADPYLVEDYADLKVVGTTATYTKAKVYKLVNDIDASASKTENAGLGFLPIGVNTPAASNFTGKFKGNGHAISSLYINRPAANYVGLFGYVTGTVDSLVLQHAYVRGLNYVGALAGYTTATAIIDSIRGVNDTLTAVTNYVGGIIGYCVGGTPKNLLNSGYVTGSTNVGGIIGYSLTNSVITNCVNTANVVATANNAGGIVGSLLAGSISNSYNTGNIKGANYVGGVIGISSTNAISLINNHNEGIITATTSYAGGIVGNTGTGAITFTNCYNDSTVIANTSYAAGIVSNLVAGSIDSCYNTGAITTVTLAGGLVGMTTATANLIPISNSYNMAAVNASGNTAGGLVGSYSTGTISSCYNKGAVKANNNAGGLVGLSSTRVVSFVDCYNAATVNALTSYAAGVLALGGTGAVSFTNCYNDSTVSAVTNYAAGIVGYFAGGSIVSCYNKDSIRSNNFAGGIVGASITSQIPIRKCTNYAAITCTTNTVGGIGGSLVNAAIDSCYNEGAIVGLNYVGGVVGTISNGSVQNSKNKATINGVGYVAGIAGNAQTASIPFTNCENTTTILATGSNAGGIAGYLQFGSVTNCLNTGNVNAVNYSAGMVGLTTTNVIPFLNCTNNGNITSSTAFAGGVVASMAAGSLINCTNTGTITASNTVGGIVGTALINAIPFTKCTNSGLILTSGNTSGGIVGNLTSGAVDSCYNAADVIGANNVGGIAGAMFNGSVKNSSNQGSVQGTSYVGGVVGFGQTNVIPFTNCSNLGAVSGSTNYVGGIAGSLVKGSFTSCFNTADISAPTNAGGILGATSTNAIAFKKTYNTGNVSSTNDNAAGLVAYFVSGSIDSCYNQGSVIANNYAGGLVGATTTVANSYTNSYNDGSVRARVNYAGGIIPSLSAGTFTNCYNLDSVSAVSYAGGIVGNTLTNVIPFQSCYNEGNVQSTADIAGGIVGFLTKGTFLSCYNKGDVNGANYVGGIVGKLSTNAVVFTDLYNEGNVRASVDYAGGIVSTASAGSSFTGCYNSGAVYASSFAGGVLANTPASIISLNNCYNTGIVEASADNAGGVVGYLGLSNPVSCYNSGIVKANNYAGGVVGKASASVMTFTDCYNLGSVATTTDYAAGIATQTTAGIYLNCYNKGDVSATNYAAGIVATQAGGSITNCYNKGLVKAKTNYAAGIAANLSAGSITNCYNYAAISGNFYVSGILGYGTTSTINKCFNTGAITGVRSVAGVIGHSPANTATNSYNTGDIKGTTYVGGFAGYATSSTFTDNYNVGLVSGSSSVGGFVGQTMSPTEVHTSYNAGYVTSTGSSTWVGAFVGFNFDAIYPNSYFDTTNSGKKVGVGYFSTPDTTLKSFPVKKMLNSTYVKDLDYTTAWQIRNDSTYPALKALDNAPFAINDTILLSAKDFLNPIATSRLMDNDYDYETLQTNLYLKIRTLSAGVTDSLLSITLPASIKNQDTIRVSYRLAEVRSIVPDTLWGNTTRSILVMDNHVPTLLKDTFSLNEDTTLTFPIDLNDVDSDVPSWSLINSTSNGSLQIISDSILYTPNLDFAGVDSLQIEITDGFMKDSVWIKLGVADLNNAPIARDTLVYPVQDMRFALRAPTALDEDSLLNIQILVQPTQGTASIVGDSIIYTPNVNAVGLDSLQWYALDGLLASSDTVKVMYDIQPQTLTLSSDTLYLDAYANATDSIFVDSNTRWTVTNTAPWLLNSASTGILADSLAFLAQENMSTSSREALVELKTSAIGPLVLYVIQRGKLQLQTTSTISIAKVYDANTNVAVTLGALANVDAQDVAKLNLSATAQYDNANVGVNKTITLHYTISGSAAGKYFAPIDTIINTASISAKQLTISLPALTKTKVYDGYTLAVVSAGALIGVEAIDNAAITIAATALYDTASVGINKSIKVSYTLGGLAAANYLSPIDTVFTDGVITPKQLSITAPDVVLDKMYDANTTAQINTIGSLQGLIAADASLVNVSAIANYNSATVGADKTISVQYTITGVASANYTAPADDLLYPAKISTSVSLSAIVAVTAGCDGAVLNIPYQVLSGEPTEYRVVFGDEAHNAGYTDLAWASLPTNNTTGEFSVTIPDLKKFGVYQASVYMRNAIGAESVAYPFSFTIKVSTDYLVPKFDDVILVDNSSKRFTSYQWYKNGAEIIGANNQFYCDANGLFGKYMARLTTSDVTQFYTCNKEIYTALRSASAITVYPSPVKVNQACVVDFNNYTVADLVGSSLTIYDEKGMKVYQTKHLEIQNSITFANKSGVYILHVELSNGNKFNHKIIVE